VAWTVIRETNPVERRIVLIQEVKTRVSQQGNGFMRLRRMRTNRVWNPEAPTEGSARGSLAGHWVGEE
jgi:hypothetical protein